MNSNAHKALRIIIFDDNRSVRESVALLLSTTENMELTAAFESCKEMLQQIELTNPDVVLMNIDMPSMNGIEILKQLRIKFPVLPVLMLTGFEDDEKIFNSICAGANGYILKNAKMESLIHYINEAAKGGAPMTPVIARKMLNLFVKVQPSQNFDVEYKLSNHERDVLQLLVKGKSYKMIADDLSVNDETVHSHTRSIYQKLQLNSVEKAVPKSISKNLVRVFLWLMVALAWWQS